MDSSNLIFDEVRRQLELQLNALESVDNKVGIMIGFNGVIFGIAASINRDIISYLWIFRIGLIALLISLLFAVISYWFRKYAADPEPGALLKYYLNEEEQSTRKQILANYVRAYYINGGILKEKVIMAKLSIIILCGGILLVFIAVY